MPCRISPERGNMGMSGTGGKLPPAMQLHLYLGSGMEIYVLSVLIAVICAIVIYNIFSPPPLLFLL